MRRPPWWNWGLVLTDHVRERMIERDFTEFELRGMIEEAFGMRQSSVPGRWIVETNLGRHGFEVVLEPDFGSREVVVVTAHAIGS